MPAFVVLFVYDSLPLIHVIVQESQQYINPDQPCQYLLAREPWWS